MNLEKICNKCKLPIHEVFVSRFPEFSFCSSCVNEDLGLEVEWENGDFDECPDCDCDYMDYFTYHCPFCESCSTVHCEHAVSPGTGLFLGGYSDDNRFGCYVRSDWSSRNTQNINGLVKLHDRYRDLHYDLISNSKDPETFRINWQTFQEDNEQFLSCLYGSNWRFDHVDTWDRYECDAFLRLLDDCPGFDIALQEREGDGCPGTSWAGTFIFSTNPDHAIRHANKKAGPLCDQFEELLSAMNALK